MLSEPVSNGNRVIDITVTSSKFISDLEDCKFLLQKSFPVDCCNKAMAINLSPMATCCSFKMFDLTLSGFSSSILCSVCCLKCKLLLG